MKTRHLILWALGGATAAAGGALAQTGTAEQSLQQSLQAYRELATRGQWVNPWRPSATGTAVAERPSADARLAEIVAGYTREALDRGGWVNLVFTETHYAAGNPLLSLPVGQGVSWRLAVAASR